MSEKSQLDYRLLLGECEIRESQAKASITDYMNICEDLSRKLEEARGRIAELTIEADRHVEEIGHLRDEGEAQDAKITELEAAIEPFVDWLEQMEQHPHVVSSKCTFEDDDLPFTVSVTWADLRNARSKLEGKSDA